MKGLPVKKIALTTLLGAAVLAATSGRAQTFLTDTYTNNFDTGGNTQPFASSGSVASWIYWYNSPGGNTAMTNDVTMDANNNASSGSLQVVSPLAGYTQNVFFGTFGNQYGYDFGTRINALLY